MYIGMVTERKRGMRIQDRYLFKAKRIKDGQWVEGAFYIEPYTDCCYIIQWNSTGLGFNEFIEVDGETICQCTGLKDKNGNLIWENDIVNGSIKRGAAFYRCLVLWNERKARFDVRAMGCNFPMTLDECTDDISMSGFDYEVVGNKFDNPELLEE